MIEKYFAFIGVLVIISGLFFALVAYQCDTNGRFKTPWWSGEQAVYSCHKEQQ